jgi:hypothetical protein
MRVLKALATALCFTAVLCAIFFTRAVVTATIHRLFA